LCTKTSGRSEIIDSSAELVSDVYNLPRTDQSNLLLPSQ
jgi:hypothetical protein